MKCDKTERLIDIMARCDADCMAVMKELSDDELAAFALADKRKMTNVYRKQIPNLAFRALVEKHEMAWLKLQQERNPGMKVDFELYEAIKTEFFETFKEAGSYEGKCTESLGSMDFEGN